MALKIYEYEKWFTNFKQKILRLGTIKHSSFYSMTENLNKTISHCSNNKKWKLYLIEKESVGKERTWECEEKMHKEQVEGANFN